MPSNILDVMQDQQPANAGSGILSIMGADDIAGARTNLAIKPEEAQKNLAIEKSTGSMVPTPDIGDMFDRLDKQTGRDIVQSDPALTGYVNSHPMAASLSSDDWPAMQAASKAMMSMTGPTAIMKLAGKPGSAASALGRASDISLLQAAAQGWKEGTENVPLPEESLEPTPEMKQAYPRLSAAVSSLLHSQVGQYLSSPGGPLFAQRALNDVFSGGLGALHKVTQTLTQQFDVPESTATSIANELTAMAESEAMGLTGRAHLGEPAEGAVRAVQDQSRQAALDQQVQTAMQLAKPYLDAGQQPPKGLHPLIDQVHAVQAILDADNGEEALKAVQGTQTWQRDPEFTAVHFLSQFPDTNISIPGEKAIELYGNKLPEPDDNLLGWVPDIHDQLVRAAVTGVDIEVPRSLWISKVDPEVAKGLNDFIRWRPEGMNREEAEEALSSKPEETGQTDVFPSKIQNLSDWKDSDVEKLRQEYFSHSDKYRQMSADLDKLGTKYNEAKSKFEKAPIGSSEWNQAAQDFEDTAKQYMQGQNDLASQRKIAQDAYERMLNAKDASKQTVQEAIEKLKAVAERFKFPDKKVPAGPFYLSPSMLKAEHYLKANWSDDAGKIVQGKQIINTSPIAQLHGSDILDQMTDAHLTGASKEIFNFFKSKIGQMAGETPISVLLDQEFEDVSRKLGQPKAIAWYNSPTHSIHVPEMLVSGAYNTPFAQTTIFHELVHAATARAIGDVPVLGQAIQKLMKEADKQLRKLDPEARKRIDYAFTNEHEFMAEVMSDPDTQEIMAQIKLPEEMVKEFGLGEKTDNLWLAFREIIRKAIKAFMGREVPNSILDGVLSLGRHFERANELYQAGNKRLGQSFAQEGPRLDQAFENSKALGLSKKHYDRLLDLAEKRNREDAEFIQKQQTDLERERLTAEWKANESRVRDEVRERMLSRPDIAADSFLRTGELGGVKYRRTRLDVDQLTPEQKEKLSPEHYGQRGIAPDELAKVVGFQSGDQMIDAIGRLQATRELEDLTPKAHLNQMVEAETDRRMRTEYKTPEQELEETTDHVLSQTNFDILHEDTLRLGTMAGSFGPISKDDIIKWAKDDFATQRVGTVNSSKLMDHVGKLGRQIEAHETAGEWTQAFRKSQQREIAFRQAQEARKFEKELKAFDKRAKQFRKRDGSKTVSVEWSNAIQDILKRTGQTVNRTLPDINREYQQGGHDGLAGFVENKGRDATIWPEDEDFPADNMSTITVADFLKNQDYNRPIEEMSVDEFRAVKGSVESLYENGRNETKFFKGQEAVELKELVHDLAEQIRSTVGPHVYPLGGKDRDNVFKTYLASLVQIESLWNRLDKGDPNGIFNRYLNLPTMAAGNERAALEKKYARLYNALPDFGKDLNKLVENRLFFDPLRDGGAIPNEPPSMTRRDMLAVLQNVGNYSNFDKVTRGWNVYGDYKKSDNLDAWRQSGYKIAMNDPVMNWLFRHTTKEDWDRAQALGDIFEQLFEHSERVYHQLGARPGARIELSPIETPFGTYKGWYHPVIYDPKRPGTSKKIMGTNPLEDGGFYRAATPAGYQKSRTGYAAPIRLSFDAIPYRLKQIVNDIAMRPVVTQLAKVFYDPAFKKAMTTGYGTEFEKLLIPYLRDIAGQRRFKDAAQATGEYWAEWAYQNVVGTLIGLNPGTVLKHGPTAAMNSIREVGLRDFLREFTTQWGHSAEFSKSNWDFAMNGGTVDGVNWLGSEELQRRARNWYETLGGAHYDLFRKGSSFDNWSNFLRDKALTIGAAPVAFSDMASALPTWTAVYKREIRNGQAHGDAVELADRAVRRAHGSTATTARPRIMRGGPLARSVAPFYTFFNDMLQRQYEMAWRAKDAAGYLKDGDYQKGLSQLPAIGYSLWSYVIFPAIVEQAISPLITGDEPTAFKVGKYLVRDVASSFPVIRDVAEAFLGGNDPSVGLYNTTAKALHDVYRDFTNKQANLSPQYRGRFIKHTASAIGVMTGLTNQQEGRWGEFAYDYATGQARPRTLGDWYRALRFGSIKEQRR